MSAMEVAVLSLLALALVMAFCLFQTGTAQIWNRLDAVPKPNAQSIGIGSQTNGTGEEVNESETSINRQQTGYVQRDTVIIKEEETGDRADRNVPINDTDLIQSSASQLDKLTFGEKFMSGLKKDGNIPLSITYSNNKTEPIFTNGESIIE